jgi:hypothetical protein
MDEQDTKTLHFSASVNEQSADAEAVAELQFGKYDPTSLSIRLQLLGTEERRLQTVKKLDKLERNHCTLYPAPPAKQVVELLGIAGMQFFGEPLQTITIDCASVQVGILNASVSNGLKYRVTAQIVPSGILMQPAVLSFHPSGEVKRERGEDHDIAVAVTHGTVNARAIYERATGEEFGNAVTKLIQRAVMTGEITGKTDESLAQIHEQFRSDLDDVCRVLSLCYRWPVTFYEIEYFDSRFAPVDGAYLRRAVAPTRRAPLGHVGLLYVGDLIDGGLGTLSNAFRSAPTRYELGRAISYLAHSYAEEGIETAYFTAFSAFETTVAAAEGKRMYALGASRWERLHDRLIGAIESFAVDENIAEAERSDLLEALGEKLPEVRRVSLRRRVHALVARFNIDVDDLWLPELGFDSGIRRATTSRNDLFHAAKLTDIDTLQGDLVRIRLLTERLILRLLNWPNSKIWPRHADNVRWANRGELESRTRDASSSA